MATIKQIAELAGVSRGTVDRVLNHRGAVSPETAERVREVARQLHYTPNKAGLLLAAQKKNCRIGVIVFSETNPFFAEVLKGVRDKAKELADYNCEVLIRQVDMDETAQFSAMEELFSAGIHGLILSPINSLYIAAEIDRLTECGVKVLTTNTDILSKRIAYIGSNYRLAGQTAAGLVSLMTAGSAHIGIVTGSSQILCHSERILGFQETLAQKGGRFCIDAVTEAHDNENESYEKTKELLAAHPDISILYFAAGGVSGGCRAAKESGRALSVFAHDCVPSTASLVLDGTIRAVICQQPYRQGYLPLDLLGHCLLENIPIENDHYYVDTDIRIKENL